jgi:hypothetical protein
VRLLESVAWPALLLAGGVVLLQAHAIPYWQARTGPAWGVLWSLQLEATAFWLLYQPGGRYRWAGLITALVLVGVPLWQLSLPVVDRVDAIRRESQGEAAAQAGRAAARLEDRIASLKQSVEGYRDQLRAITTALAAADNADPARQRQLAATRARLQARLAAAEKTLGDKQDSQPTPSAAIGAGFDGLGPLDWLRASADVLPAAAGLVLFQSVNVLAILSISRFRHGAAQPEPPAEPPRVSPPPPPSLSPPPPQEKQRPPRETVDFTPVSLPDALPEIARAGEIPVAPEAPVGVKPAAAPVPVSPRPLRLADEMTIRRLQHELAVRIRASGGTAADWCRREGVQPRDLSFLLNHFERAAQHKDTISVPKLAELVTRYLTPAKEGTGA